MTLASAIAIQVPVASVEPSSLLVADLDAAGRLHCRPTFDPDLAAAFLC